MAEATRIVDELTRAIDGDPWHGNSVVSILQDVDATTARFKVGAAHTIWEIVRHMTAWTKEVQSRVEGHPAGEPQEGDWPSPSGTTEHDWQQDMAALVATHHRLLTAVATLSDRSLQAPSVDPRNRPSGSGVSHYVLLHGLSQHHAYHAGQIALLKKAASGS
jgi:hypothetical protein